MISRILHPLPVFLILLAVVILTACHHPPTPDASLFPDAARLEHENARLAAKLLNR